MNIRENILALLSFLLLLLSALLSKHHPISEKPTWAKEAERRGEKLEREGGRYRGLIGPSRALIPTEPYFCPKCHTLVCHLRRMKHGVQIIQGNKVLVTIGNLTTKRGGKVKAGFPMRCPNGHEVRIE